MAKILRLHYFQRKKINDLKSLHGHIVSSRRRTLSTSYSLAAVCMSVHGA